MPLQPTRHEARWLIVVLVAGSAAPALAGIEIPEALVGAAIVASLITWYALVFRVAARERSASVKALTRACIRTLDPRWYAGVVRMSEWNSSLAGAAVVAATGWSIYELIS